MLHIYNIGCTHIKSIVLWHKNKAMHNVYKYVQCEVSNPCYHECKRSKSHTASHSTLVFHEKYRGGIDNVYNHRLMVNSNVAFYWLVFSVLQYLIMIPAM